MREKSEVRIKELEEDIKTLTLRSVERETEMERSEISPPFSSTFDLILCYYL